MQHCKQKNISPEVNEIAIHKLSFNLVNYKAWVRLLNRASFRKKGTKRIGNQLLGGKKTPAAVLLPSMQRGYQKRLKPGLLWLCEKLGMMAAILFTFW